MQSSDALIRPRAADTKPLNAYAVSMSRCTKGGSFSRRHKFRMPIRRPREPRWGPPCSAKPTVASRTQ